MRCRIENGPITRSDGRITMGFTVFTDEGITLRADVDMEKVGVTWGVPMKEAVDRTRQYLKEQLSLVEYPF